MIKEFNIEATYQAKQLTRIESTLEQSKIGNLKPSFWLFLSFTSVEEADLLTRAPYIVEDS